MMDAKAFTDIMVGICEHASECCPHFVVGVAITGSPNTLTNSQPQTGVSDIMITTCPHCHIGIALTGHPLVLTNGKPTHRLGDVEMLPGGVGIMVTGSPNCITGASGV